MARFSTFSRLFQLWAVVAFVGLPLLGAEAGNSPKGSEVKFQGQLVWGTNDDPKKHPQFKQLDVRNQKILKNSRLK